MPTWGMVVDITRCSGCTGCQVACKAENATPPGVTWTRMEYVEVGVFPSVHRVTVPVGCMHCRDPECLRVCPTGATYKREDGIVAIDTDMCIGCKSCMIACPYGARYIREDERGYFGETLTPYEREGYARHRVGAISKCDFCAHRIDEGLAHGLVPGVDPDATPACVANCWTKARYFGDLDDPGSLVARMVACGQAIQLRPEPGIDPQVYYLAPGRGSVPPTSAGELANRVVAGLADDRASEGINQVLATHAARD